MTTGRMEAFSDGVIAILITIMVLELHAPEGTDWASLHEELPTLLAYVLSFAYLGIYWNNHHHMLQLTDRVTGVVLWANLHLLFWLSLVPFTTAWMGEHHEATVPVVAYGITLLAAALAYYLLQTVIIRDQGEGSLLQAAVGGDWKGRISPVLYATGIASAYVEPWVSLSLYVAVAVLWFVPDRRLETALVSG